MRLGLQSGAAAGEAQEVGLIQHQAQMGHLFSAGSGAGAARMPAWQTPGMCYRHRFLPQKRLCAGQWRAFSFTVLVIPSAFSYKLAKISASGFGRFGKHIKPPAPLLPVF